METIWFLVVILAGCAQDILDRMPVQYPTQVQCSTAGLDLFISKHSPLDLYCIEADDGNDLVKIMNQTFNFGGDNV